MRAVPELPVEENRLAVASPEDDKLAALVAFVCPADEVVGSSLVTALAIEVPNLLTVIPNRCEWETARSEDSGVVCSGPTQTDTVLHSGLKVSMSECPGLT